MKREGESQASVIPPVRRSKEKAKQFHGRISRFYDYVIGAFERKWPLRACLFKMGKPS